VGATIAIKTEFLKALKEVRGDGRVHVEKKVAVMSRRKEENRIEAWIALKSERERKSS
jgi:hypothetical protein